MFLQPIYSDLIALWLFIAFMVGTPGPANLLIMSAGAQFGLRKSMPFNFGLITGKILLNLSMAFGLLILLVDYPLLHTILKYISAAYMIFLAMRSWNQASGSQVKKPQMRFWQGVLVHPLNPKAWVMSIFAWTEFGPALGSPSVQLLIIPASFAVAQLIFHTSWCGLGVLTARAMPQSLLLTRALTLITVAVVLWAVFA